MHPITKLVSFWAFVGLVLFLVLQAIPILGLLVLMVGALGLTAILVHGLLIALFVEAIMRRVPLVLVLVPIAAYGAYYAIYFYQWIDIERTSAALRASNPGRVFDFDPLAHSLVMHHAEAVVRDYAIPAAYQANVDIRPEGYLSFRLIRRDQCNNVRRDTQNRVFTFGVHFAGRFQQSVCMLRFPEEPPFKAVRAERRGDEGHRHKWGISQQVTDIFVDDVVLASYRTASAWRLPVVPVNMLLGCASGFMSPGLQCGVEFHQTRVELDTVPNSVDRRSYDSPVSVMLGLKKYTASDLAGFQGYERNASALVRVATEPERVEDSVFEILAAVISGQSPKLPNNFGYALAQNPDRLVPFAKPMAARLVELNDEAARRTANGRDQASGLATALASLPREAFVSVSAPIFAVVRQPLSWDRYPALYLRGGDIGLTALEFYKNEFMVGKFKPFLRMLPVLAICRIGQADHETISEMKQRLSVGGSGSLVADDDYKSALFVTLMKLGEQAYLRDDIQSLPVRLQPWASAVLEGQGASEVGPNNCMGQRWTAANYLVPTMEPGLRLTRGTWAPRT